MSHGGYVPVLGLVVMVLWVALLWKYAALWWRIR